MDPSNFDRFVQTLFPHYHAETARVRRDGKLFAHYTSAETALKIIRGRRLWLPPATTMNDYTEVRHGINCFQQAWDGDAGKKLKNAIDLVQPGATNKLDGLLRSSVLAFELNTHLACFSEWDPNDKYGRLSMWRAYGRNAGVALVFEREAFLMENPDIGVAASPVAYFDPSSFGSRMLELARRITEESAFLRAGYPERFHEVLLHVIRLGMLCTKHPGFLEEHEWRLVHTPTYDHNGGLIIEVETIRGVPQVVKQLVLEAKTATGEKGVDLKAVLNRVVIGPTQFETPMFMAFNLALQEAGIDPRDKIEVSRIPVRPT